MVWVSCSSCSDVIVNELGTFFHAFPSELVNVVSDWDCFNGLNTVAFSSPFQRATALAFFVQVLPTQALARTGFPCLLILLLFSITRYVVGPNARPCWHSPFAHRGNVDTRSPALSPFLLVTAWVLELPNVPQTKAQGDVWTLEGTESRSVVPEEGLRQKGVLFLSP